MWSRARWEGVGALTASGVAQGGVPVSAGVAVGALDAWAALLREQAPSAETAASLDDLQGEWLSPRGRIDALAVVERHLSWLQAKQVELLAAISDHAEGHHRWPMVRLRVWSWMPFFWVSGTVPLKKLPVP